MSSSRQICNIFSWLELLNYCPDGGNGDFQFFGSFLTDTFCFVKLNNLVLYIRTIFFGLTHCDRWLREFGLCIPYIYNPVEQEVMTGQFQSPWCAIKCKYEWINFRDILLIRISRGANNGSQHALEKKHLFHNVSFPPLSIVLLHWKFRILCNFWKIKKINDANLFSQQPLLILTKGANISGWHCMCVTSLTCQLCFSALWSGRVERMGPLLTLR